MGEAKENDGLYKDVEFLKILNFYDAHVTFFEDETRGQLAKHVQVLIKWSCFQKKALRIGSIRLIIHFGI